VCLWAIQLIDFPCLLQLCWPTNSWVFRINATNACSNSISLKPERRRSETKECPTNVPWSLMKHSTILSSCSSEIVQYPVTSCSSYSWTRRCSVHRESRNISAILVHVNPDEQNWRGTSDIESFGQPTLPDFAVCEHPKRKLQAAWMTALLSNVRVKGIYF